MIKKCFVLFFCFTFIGASALFLSSAEKKPINGVRSQNIEQHFLIFQASCLIVSNPSYIFVVADLKQNDQNNIIKKFGDIPIGKPGTRD
jgi:hypothetical protein